MRRATRWSAAVAASFIGLMGAGHLMGVGHAATQEQIGSWVLSCPGGTPGSEPCVMRMNKRLLDKAGITSDLEIQAQGKSLVPVITLRGLSNEMLMAAASMGGRAEASIQLGSGPREDLNCAPNGAGYFCSPRDAAVQKLATALPEARSAVVRVAVSMPGMSPLPAQERSVDLSGTKDALARLRLAGASPIPSAMSSLGPQSPAVMANGNGMMEMADKALKAAGYQDGVAGLQAMLARQLKK